MIGGQKRKGHFTRVLVFIAVIIIAVCGSVFLVAKGLSVGVASAEEAFSRTLVEVKEKTAQEYYDWAFGKGEEEYHTSNKVYITVGEIEGRSKLEVLKVSDVEFIIQNAGENDEEVTAWIAVPGDGVFTVDMTMSEFLIDNIRHIVVARIPQPRLTSCKVESENIEIYELKTGAITNGSYSQGVTLAEEHLKQGYDMIKNEFLSNQQYFLSAKQSAENLIIRMIKNLNSEIKDLYVEVEFVD